MSKKSAKPVPEVKKEVPKEEPKEEPIPNDEAHTEAKKSPKKYPTLKFDNPEEMNQRIESHLERLKKAREDYQTLFTETIHIVQDMYKILQRFHEKDQKEKGKKESRKGHVP